MGVEVLYASIFHEGLELRREGLRHESQDCLDTNVLDEAVILLLWVSTAVDAPGQNCTVICGGDQGL